MYKKFSKSIHETICYIYLKLPTENIKQENNMGVSSPVSTYISNYKGKQNGNKEHGYKTELFLILKIIKFNINL